jgi:hypothetical protein
MTGATITIDDATATDTILSVKERVFSASAITKLPVHRQRLMYRPGPHGINPLADDETLGGAGVARDGTAELDVLLADLTAEEVVALGEKARALGVHCDCIEAFVVHSGNHFIVFIFVWGSLDVAYASSFPSCLGFLHSFKAFVSKIEFAVAMRTAAGSREARSLG